MNDPGAYADAKDDAVLEIGIAEDEWKVVAAAIQETRAQTTMSIDAVGGYPTIG